MSNSGSYPGRTFVISGAELKDWAIAVSVSQSVSPLTITVTEEP